MSWEFTEREPHLWTQDNGRYQIAGFFTKTGEARFNLIRFHDDSEEGFDVVATGFTTLKSAKQFIQMKFKPAPK